MPSEQTWQTRELSRFQHGVYKSVPWAQEPWFLKALETEPFSFHFLHVSTTDSSLVAFTETPEKGQLDRQTKTKPGRYLQRFFSSQLTTKDLQYWCGKFSTENTENEVHFAATAEEIEWVYLNGPHSCMAHPPSYYNSEFHPVRVYAAGDLAIAYLKNPSTNRVSARAICWPEKRVFGRIYGDDYRLSNKLYELGYGRGINSEFNGARLKLTRSEYGDNTVICPYLDVCGSFDVEDNFLVLSNSGSYSGESQSGLAYLVERASCANCGEACDEDDLYTVGDESWCESCVDNHAFSCECCNERFSNDCTSYEVIVRLRPYSRTDTYCESCYDRFCGECHQCEEHFHSNFLEEAQDGYYYCRDHLPEEEEEEEKDDLLTLSGPGESQLGFNLDNNA